MLDVDESNLLTRLQAGEDTAFGEVVRLHGPALLSTARRMLGDQAAAEDVLQEAFLSAFKAIGRFEGRSGLKTWLHRIVVNAALMRRRSTIRRAEEPIDDFLPVYDETGFRMETMCSAEPTPEDATHRAKVDAMVRERIDWLPESYRNVLLLRDIEELSTKEVADLLGVSEGAVKIRLHRARTALKTLLEPLFKEAQP